LQTPFGQMSETQSLPQAGLPQGSPLSQILFLFFNADLVHLPVERFIDNCLNTFPVTLRSWSCHPCGKVIYERLPQGSPLSQILFLFFNADLVQRRIDSQGGAIALRSWSCHPCGKVIYESNRSSLAVDPSLY
jgi:hypothetical protein